MLLRVVLSFIEQKRNNTKKQSRSWEGSMEKRLQDEIKDGVERRGRR